ncbi:nuclear transport factor 2 family protein [Glaciecola sp. 1036]|uniref:nuclear transport factor 2 family protein n=1 Tax=Alteromonadaceae TaxID=72275 RepID=UPI003D05DF9E
MHLLDKFSTFYSDLASMKVDKLSEIYSQNVVFADPVGRYEGISAVENYFTKLLKNAKYCEFDIHDKLSTTDGHHVITWTMKYISSRINNGKPVSVDGITWLETQDNKITLHRDYYDLGQMAYEHVPILGYFVKSVKRRIG